MDTNIRATLHLVLDEPQQVLLIHTGGVVNVSVNLSHVVEIAMGNSLKMYYEMQGRQYDIRGRTFMSASSWNSLRRLYMVNLLERYLSLRYAKLFVGPSEMTPSTYSRSMKYSRMSGIVKAGLCSGES